MKSETIYRKRFWVSGPGPLPPDMLRYERAYPDRESDGHEARRTGRFLTVQLVMCTSDPDREPDGRRWQSFGWFVHESEQSALAAGLPQSDCPADASGVVSERCPRCDGERCDACFHTGKALYQIGDRVVFDNQDHSLAPPSVQAEYEKHLGLVYSVTSIMDCPGERFSNFYYVGIDLSTVRRAYGSTNNLVFDVNLRPATADELTADETADELAAAADAQGCHVLGGGSDR